MTALLLVAGSVFGLVTTAVVVRARRLKERHRAAFAAPGPRLQSAAARVFEAPRALYHGTRFADGAKVLVARWGTACVGDLWCTREGIFLLREDGGEPIAIPFDSVSDAALLRAYAPIAGKDLPMLRLRWHRGGEPLATDFSLPGGMANLEKLRREVHLRQGKDAVAALLAPFFERASELGK